MREQIAAVVRMQEYIENYLTVLESITCCAIAAQSKLMLTIEEFNEIIENNRKILK